MKKITISALAALSLCCIGGGALALGNSTPVAANADPASVYMIEGGSVRLSTPSGLGFMTRIDYEYYNGLVANNYEVKTGTILLPTDYLTESIDLTAAHASLEANDVLYLDVPNVGFRNAATAEKDTYYEFRGSVAPMNVLNENRPYSAVGYVATKATEETAEYTYVYTAYDAAKHSRSLENVAYDAFVDRNATYDEEKKYLYKVEADGTYSPYTSDQLTILAGYMKETVLTGTAIVEETADTLNASALSTAFTAQSFVASEITAITRYGADVTLESGTADVSKNGIYDVTLSGTYTNEKGVKIPATMNAEVDVWSADTKYTVAGLTDMSSVGGYQGISGGGGSDARKMFTVGDKTAELLQIKPKETEVYYFRPMHSKAYYQALLTEFPAYVTAYVSMDWYLDTGSYTTALGTYFNFFDGYVKNIPELNSWVQYKMSLTDFVALYDSISAYYKTTRAEVLSETKFARYDGTKGAVDIDGNTATGYLASGYFYQRVQYTYLSAMTVTQEAGVYEEATLLVDRKTVTSVDLSEHTETGKDVLNYWTSNGYTLTYDLTARYGGADWNGTNEKTFAITDSAESGIYNLSVTATKGEDSNVCLTRQIDVYNSTEAVEYESLKHNDSNYAVKVYALEFSQKMSETSGLNTVAQSWIESNTTHSHDVTFTGSGTDSDTFYMLNLDKTTGAIEYDWSSEDTQNKLDTLKAYASSEQEYIVTYVMPRHSKAYYEAYKDSCGKIAYKFRSSNVAIKYYYMSDVTTDSCSLYFTGRYWGNADRTPTVTATVETLINNYDAFNNCKVPMLIIKNCSATTTTTASSKLYGISFESASV